MEDRRIAGAVVLILVLAVLVYGLSTSYGSGSNLKESKVKVGVVTPLSGAAAPYGDSVMRGLRIAKDHINSEGGINGRKIKLVIEDSKCQPKTAIKAFNKLLSVDKVVGVVGNVCSAATVPLSKVAEEKNTPIVAAAASNPKITDSNYAFRTVPNDMMQGKAIAEYIRNDMGEKKVGILAMNDEYGKGLVKQFRNDFKQLGGDVVHTEYFDMKATDFRTQITKLGEHDFEVLLTIGAPNHHPMIAKQLSEFGKDWKRVGDGTIDVVPEESVNKHLREVIYPALVFNESATDNAQILAERMGSRFDRDPDATSAAAFDSLLVFAKAAEKCEPVTSKCVKENLKGILFQGASGPNQLTESGDLQRANYKFRTLG